MTGLRWYEDSGISTSASQLRQRFESGAMGWLEYSVQASQYCFRDPDGKYTFLDCVNDRWYRFESGSWHLLSTPPDRLEGLESLAKFVEIPEGALAGLPDTMDKSEKMPDEVLETFRQAARQSYLNGRSSSVETERMLARLLLLDREGFFWGVGFRSGKWYRFSDGLWDLASARPVRQQLIPAGSELEELPENAAVRVYQFLLRGAGTLPEPVTEPWDPPVGFPDIKEPGFICEVCGEHNLPSSRYCSQCGALLGCPNCGAQNPPGSRFCNQCGQVLVTTEKVES